MDQAIGGSPCEDPTEGEFVEYWSLNYAIESVKFARKIIERELFRLENFTLKEKVQHMKTFRKKMTKELNEHYEKRFQDLQKQKDNKNVTPRTSNK